LSFSTGTGNETNPIDCMSIHFLKMYILEIDEYPENFEKPYDNNHYYHSIENVFYLMVHWDIIIDQPK
jgi:hypothetical protein